jgi:hypothetical protein
MGLVSPIRLAGMPVVNSAAALSVPPLSLTVLIMK